MNPDAKMSDQDDSGEIFEFRPILPLFWSKKLSLQILSYGYLNEASWWDKFSDAQENFFEGQYGPQNGTFILK